jgi:hypothetical protein
MFALISTEELAELNQIMVKQLKNRYNDAASNRKFLQNINRAKMKLYDINNSSDNTVIPVPTENQKKQNKFENWNF